ncbi:MAG: hypothetical protein ACYC4U_02540 [Pirellulaceae bacterium]
MRILLSGSLVLLLLGMGRAGLGQEVDLGVPPTAAGTDSTEDTEILARGPVHEAFAEQVSPNPEPGIVVAKTPPEPIEEIAPEFRPEGDDVTWIPGYWFWDEDRNDYVWISGVWRRFPPDRRWVPGYWQEVEGGYQWIAGFWGSVATEAVEYLDPPPESLETGPSSPAPSDDSFWVPGNWVYETNAYRWRAGYWRPFRPSWTWVASRYNWTSRGCVYVPGYWDHSLARRGFLFAPVYFRSPIFYQPGYRYRPTYWIGADALLLHMFVAPRYNHLFFGDYYSPFYRQRHFYPSYHYHGLHRGYASLYGYYDHHYRRRGIDYGGRMRQWHDYYARNVDLRPAHTYGRQRDRGHDGPHREWRSGEQVVRPFEIARSDAGHRLGGQNLVPLASRDEQRVREHVDQTRRLSSERRNFEVDRAFRESNGAPGRDNNMVANRGRFVLPDTLSQEERRRSPFAPRGADERTRPDSEGASFRPRESGRASDRGSTASERSEAGRTTDRDFRPRGARTGDAPATDAANGGSRERPAFQPRGSEADARSRSVSPQGEGRPSFRPRGSEGDARSRSVAPPASSGRPAFQPRGSEADARSRSVSPQGEGRPSFRPRGSEGDARSRSVAPPASSGRPAFQPRGSASESRSRSVAPPASSGRPSFQPRGSASESRSRSVAPPASSGRPSFQPRSAPESRPRSIAPPASFGRPSFQPRASAPESRPRSIAPPASSGRPSFQPRASSGASRSAPPAAQSRPSFAPRGGGGGESSFRSAPRGDRGSGGGGGFAPRSSRGEGRSGRR